MSKISIRDLDLNGKRVFIRVDFNVPLAPGGQEISPTETLGKFLRDVMRNNMTSFRLFSPDENASNRLQDVYAASKKTWLAEIRPEDADGADLAPDGRAHAIPRDERRISARSWLEFAAWMRRARSRRQIFRSGQKYPGTSYSSMETCGQSCALTQLTSTRYGFFCHGCRHTWLSTDILR